MTQCEPAVVRAGGGNRTHDLTITSRLRYQLRHTGRSSGRSPSPGPAYRSGRAGPGSLAGADRGRWATLASEPPGWQAGTPMTDTPAFDEEPPPPLDGPDEGPPVGRAVALLIVFVVVTAVLVGIVNRHPGPSAASTATTAPHATSTTAPGSTTTTTPPSKVPVLVANGSGAANAATTFSNRAPDRRVATPCRRLTPPPRAWPPRASTTPPRSSSRRPSPSPPPCTFRPPP